MLDQTHAVEARSWVASANALGTDFPIQNLPFCVFRRADRNEAYRCGVGIGDEVLDLAYVASKGLLSGAALDGVNACKQTALNEFFALGPDVWRAVRHGLFALLEDGGSSETTLLHDCLVPMVDVEYAVPTRIGDYTDFYTSLDHARNVGQIWNPANPVSRNFQWMPIAYHGRASTIEVSGHMFHRPLGQTLPADGLSPALTPCRQLDYELELAIWVGKGNRAGRRIDLVEAESHIFGLGLLNDWSARDIQSWEMAPLGPFLAKNFATTVSPWIVTMDALKPYRLPWDRPVSDPQPLPYLDGASNREQGSLDIQLEVWIEDAKKSAQSRISATSFKHQYWTVAQMITHHTVGAVNSKSVICWEVEPSLVHNQTRQER